MQKKVLKQISLWLPPFLLMLVIFNLSSNILPQVTKTYWGDFTFKKSSHIIFYGLLALLYFRALIGSGIKKAKSAFYSIAMAVFYGISDEIHQSFVPGRESTVRDLFFDGFGASIVIYLVYTFLPKFPKKIRVIADKLGII